MKELNESWKELSKTSQRLKEHLAQTNPRRERAGEREAGILVATFHRAGRVERAATGVIWVRLGCSSDIMRMSDLEIGVTHTLKHRSPNQI